MSTAAASDLGLANIESLSVDKVSLHGDRYKNSSTIHGGFLTEVDIAKIVANKYAKNAPAEDRVNYSQLVREEFRNVYRVWSAFVKFIRSQTAGKQKLVDTTFIGHLHKRDDEPINNSNLELLVSQDFYEAGKFKNKQPPNYSRNEEIIKVRDTSINITALVL